MAHADWTRIREHVGQLSNPLPYAANVGWTFLSIAVCAFVAYLPWAGAQSQLDIKAQLHYAWVSPSLVIFGFASSVIAAISSFYAHAWSEHVKLDVAQVARDMDAVYAPHKSAREKQGL